MYVCCVYHKNRRKTMHWNMDSGYTWVMRQ